MADTNPKISILQLPGSDTIYDIHAKSSVKLDNPVTMTVTGDASGSVSFDGTEDVSLEITLTKEVSDEKVKQSGIDTGAWRGAILGKSTSGDEGGVEKEVTDQVYTSDNITMQPSTGTVKANVYRFGDSAQMEYDATVGSIKFVFLQ